MRIPCMYSVHAREVRSIKGTYVVRLAICSYIVIVSHEHVIQITTVSLHCGDLDMQAELVRKCS